MHQNQKSRTNTKIDVRRLYSECVTFLPTARRDGFSWVCRIDIPGTMIAGNVLERSNGGGTLRPDFPVPVCAAMAAAAL